MENTLLHINVDKVLKNELKSEAKSKGLTLNAYVRMLLMERSK